MATELRGGLEDKMVTHANRVIHFGKHKGDRLKDVPRDYLEWVALHQIGGRGFADLVAEFLYGPASRADLRVAREQAARERHEKKMEAAREAKRIRLEREKRRRELSEAERAARELEMKEYRAGKRLLAAGDCSSWYNPQYAEKLMQPWDGVSPPWIDQIDSFGYDIF